MSEWADPSIDYTDHELAFGEWHYQQILRNGGKLDYAAHVARVAANAEAGHGPPKLKPDWWSR